MTEHEIIEDLVEQFAYCGECKNGLALYTGGLSVLEHAFDYLDWDDPHYVPERECQVDGCHKEATCGHNTKNGYMLTCTKHWREITEKEEKET